MNAPCANDPQIGHKSYAGLFHCMWWVHKQGGEDGTGNRTSVKFFSWEAFFQTLALSITCLLVLGAVEASEPLGFFLEIHIDLA